MHARVRRLVTLLVPLALACGGDPAGPGAGGGAHYRLVAVEDTPLPAVGRPRIGGRPARVTHGDLVLRGDGSFTLGVVDEWSAFGLLLDGRADADGDSLHLDVALSGPGSEPFRLSGTRRGNRLVLELGDEAWPSAYAFERVPGWRPAAAERYVLGAVDGRADRSWTREREGDRYVEQVVFDSLHFTDGVFFRRHRETRHVVHRARGDSIVSGLAWSASGAYAAAPAWRVLRTFGYAEGVPPRDSLEAAAGALVRRTALRLPATGERVVREERYDRLP